MKRDCVTAAIVLAFLKTSSYVSKENGPASPGRWHGAQFLKMIGAMFSLKVGFLLVATGLQPVRNDKDRSAILSVCFCQPEELMKASVIIILLLGGLLAGSAAALSHHSFAAEFDASKPITLKGTITKIDLVNPHSWLYLNVKDADGKVVNWAIEMGSPNNLIRRGINKNTVPVGIEVTVDGYRAKDGTSTANGTTIRLPDGRQLFAASSAPDAPQPKF